VRKTDNLPPSCAVVTKSGNLNFLEPSGPVQTCNGTALPLPFTCNHCGLRYCAISRKVTGSFTNGVNGIFYSYNRASRTMALGWDQILT
jgi:hypothetical protein